MTAPDHWDAKLQAAFVLALDGVAAEVARALDDARVPFLLLKGASIRTWLYGEHAHRWHADVDVLVRPDRHERARAVLEELGFAEDAIVDDSRRPSHGRAWRRPPFELDLHRTLPMAAADPWAVWSRLEAGAVGSTIRDVPIRHLSVPALAMHLALHLSQAWNQREKKLAELDLAIDRVADVVWEDAAGLASELDAAAAFDLGLRSTPAGAAVADRLRTARSEADRAVRLSSRGAPGPALALDWILQQQGRERLRTILRTLAPSPTFIRSWSPWTRRFGLVGGYVHRVLWLLRAAPTAVWYVARSGRRS